jgi:hypothetical protein
LQTVQVVMVGTMVVGKMAQEDPINILEAQVVKAGIKVVGKMDQGDQINNLEAQVEKVVIKVVGMMDLVDLTSIQEDQEAKVVTKVDGKMAQVDRINIQEAQEVREAIHVKVVVLMAKEKAMDLAVVMQIRKIVCKKKEGQKKMLLKLISKECLIQLEI